MLLSVTILLFVQNSISSSTCYGNYSKVIIPNNLLIGSATSAYQVEGAWNEDGKGENIWDNFVHNHPEKIVDRSNGDVASDSYHKVKEDVRLMKNLGFQVYRFSISWSRVLPEGFENKINPFGIAYYNTLIDELLAADIVPVATIYHFDLPQPLQDLGGWTNPNVVKWFTNYARVLFDYFGDRVKIWITINEPKQQCRFTYGQGLLAPGIISEGLGEYLCIHYALLAHAHVYRLYLNNYKIRQHGEIGISIDCSWPEITSKNDQEALDRKIAFDIDMFINPIFGQFGDYPDLVKSVVAQKSANEGYAKSRLPKFTPKEISLLQGSSDFLGVNYYLTTLVKTGISNWFNTKDMEITEIFPEPKQSDMKNIIKLRALGLRKMLRYIKTKYGNPTILITENGIYTEAHEINDIWRIYLYKMFLKAVVDATTEDRIIIKTFILWSLLDNFEWFKGYKNRFGLFYINFTNPERERVPKASAHFFKAIMKTRTFQLE